MNVTERATDLFTRTFGASPRAIGSAPGRVNLIGDHVDYAGGLAMPLALDQRTAVAVGASPQAESVAVSELDAHATACWSGKPPPGVASFLSAVRRLASKSAPVPERGPLAFAVASDVPIGKGLSSSAALGVAACCAIDALLGIERAATDRARLCRDAEEEATGVPCGLLDQLTAAVGSECGPILIDFAAERFTRLGRSPSSLRVAIFDTGVARTLADGRYAELNRCARAAIEAANEQFGEHRLAQLQNTEPLSNVTFPSERSERVAHHIVSETRAVERAAAAWERGDGRALGSLMIASHENATSLLGISTPKVDRLVKSLRQSPHVYGARMTGGGFGGSVVALVDDAADPAGLLDRSGADHGAALLAGDVKGGAAASGERVG
jgi:galactokinase